MRPVADAFKLALTSIVSKLKAGNPFDSTDKAVRLSALFNEGSAENVINMIKEAKSDGAELLLGDLNRQGAVVQPHLVWGVKPGMRLWDKESFGPGAFSLSSSFSEITFTHRWTRPCSCWYSRGRYD